ncbi:glycoside hydrolase family 35 protein [Aaosphaeria arxii CBS 175.79]|uniref:beta-galactosidase n=1 Tax=Aaosphaeria arxii CBS 175.79 TaxID=1450172 RepID=A0A6A5Y519_9PLEO|nr:glycoside hydrolase family 35 protein [Aaosphaeria arxii CBS 175.79]KAF2020369.1 glycoside hydrolase family 35 protein [Aaosphaeria arxii CBS 175.79]
MKLHRVILNILVWANIAAATDNGLQSVVTWDNGSLLIDGQRVIIMSGEFHYQRLPVPELWLDVFQKFKANGMNAVSIYFFWSYHSAAKGQYDFTTPAKDIQRMFDLAREAGLYVIARPGPYCNAETNGGGFALWTSDGSGGKYRTSDETYRRAWSEWITEVGTIIAKNQITNGGPVILAQVENELQQTKYDPQDTLVIYMEQLKKAFHDAGIVVPITHNEKGMRSKSWSSDYKNVGGAVDIYGLDNYPGGMSCSNPDTGFNLPRTYYQWFQEVSFTQPEYLPEFEGGWFQPWNGYFYDQCQAEQSPEFADVFYKGVIAQRVTLLNIYMAFGGTNWGHSAAPVVYTSYDYDAPLRETREVRDKFKQFKLLALFTRVSKGLHNTIMESNGTQNAVDSSAIWTWALKSRDTTSRFYLAENNNTRSRAKTNFAITVSTSLGKVSIPTMQLDGRQSRWVVTDYDIGNETLLYSSAEIITYGTFDKSVLVFYLREGQIGEFAFKASGANVTFETYGSASDLRRSDVTGTTRHTKFVYTQGRGASMVQLSNGVLAYLLDIPSAYTFFAPSTSPNPNVQAEQQVFVLGPSLVRAAEVTHNKLSLVGDTSKTTTIEVYAGSNITTLLWNNVSIPFQRTKYNSLTASIQGPQSSTIKLPELTNFRSADSLLEIHPNYTDTHWIIANKTTTPSPVTPLTLPVLFSSDYGFYVGAKIYRGHFSGKGAMSLNLTVQGGSAAGWNAWLNGRPLGHHPGDATQSATTAVLAFKGHALNEKDNVITILTDYTGHDQTSVRPAGAENPRGILGAQLLGANNEKLNFDIWRIQGNAGGSNNLDPVRGPMNEGGLYGERLGWHLPGFDTSKWEKRSPLTDGVNGVGVQWYATTFGLDIDGSLDVPIGIEIGASPGTVARVLIFVNGYQYGKFLPHIGPQTRFPIPPGILNTQGLNTLSIALWSQADTGAKLNTLQLIEYAKFRSGFGFGNIDTNILQPGWKDRSNYA